MSARTRKANEILSRPVGATDPSGRRMQSEEADESLSSDILFSDTREREPVGLPDLDILGADPALFSEPAFSSGEPPHVPKVDAAEAQRLEEWLYGEQRSGGLASVMQSSADKLESARKTRGRK